MSENSTPSAQFTSSASAELVSVFARMAGLLLGTEAVDEALRLVTQLAAEAIPGTSGAGVTLIDDAGEKISAATTDTLAAQADELQYNVNEGPCLAAWAGRRMVRVDDVRTDPRWPRWSAPAAELGILSAVSVPLISDASALGAIKVYSTQERAFGDHAERLLTLFSEQAAILVANAQRFAAANRLSEDLKSALGVRDLIAQARGVLMGRRGIDSETALTTMIATARREGTTLRVVADNINTSASRRSS